MPNRKVIYTIGHSNRSLQEFIKLLKKYNIKRIIDVRRFPTSRHVPHFKKEVLERELPKQNIEYYWLGDLLGGFRPGGYIKYMETEEFSKGLRKLLEIAGREGRTAIMCRERLWFKCHRRFISDRLVELGYKVIHIIDDERTYEHKRKPKTS